MVFQFVQIFSFLQANDTPPSAVSPDLFSQFQHWQQIATLITGIATGTVGSIVIFAVRLWRELRTNAQKMDRAIKPMENAVVNATVTVEEHKEKSEVAHKQEQTALTDLKNQISEVIATGQRRDEKLEDMAEQIAHLTDNLDRLSRDTSVIFSHLISNKKEPRR